MRIRITDVSNTENDDLPLSCWGLTVGDEFEVEEVVNGTFVIECDEGYAVVYPRECEVLED